MHGMGICPTGSLFVLLLLTIAPLSMLVPQSLSAPDLYGYDPATVGYLVVEAGTGLIVAEHNADRFFSAASVVKCLTAAAAFELLGHGFRFTTSVYVDSGPDPATGSVAGDLYVVGGGDPGLVVERVWVLANQLRLRGITGITGDVVIDESFFDSARVGPGFTSPASRAYNAPIAPFSVHFNTVEVHCRPGDVVGGAVQAGLFPRAETLRASVTARTGSVGTPAGVKVGLDNVNGAEQVRVTGAMAQGGEHRVFYRRITNPGRHSGQVLAALLAEAGISVGGSVRTAPLPREVRLNSHPVYEASSQPLTWFVANMFKYSSNFTAEMILRTLSALHGPHQQGSWNEGVALLGKWWKENGLPGEPLVLNGSGMGAANRLTCRQTVALLGHVLTRDAYRPDFLSSLAVAGVDGTLEQRFERSPLKGRVRAKTGTLAGVATLAGYVLDGGISHLFAIFVNNTDHGHFEHWALQQHILEQVVLHR